MSKIHPKLAAEHGSSCEVLLYANTLHVQLFPLLGISVVTAVQPYCDTESLVETVVVVRLQAFNHVIILQKH